MTRKLTRPEVAAPRGDATLITTLLEDDAELTERPAKGAVPGSRAGERYRLCFEIASGGMATVYLAMMEGPGGFSRPVALKRIHEHLAQRAEFVRMFQDEARISAQIVHPNVCQVYDFGSSDDRHYLAMEFLVGETLSRVVPAAMSRPDGNVAHPRYRALIAHLFAEACEGLHAAHIATGPDGEPLGIVHRDVSPRNLLVTFDGRMKVLDFGIAHAANRTERTRTGELKGSLAYVSPEQVHAKPTDARSDLWSLGVCLWECFAGRRLFRRASSADTLYAVVSEPLPSLTEVCPELPSSYREAVERALRRDVDERWPDARAFGEALREAIRGDEEAPTVATVAPWMDELFPDGRENARDLLKRAADSRFSLMPDETTVKKRGGGRRIFVGLAIGAGALALAGGGVAVGLRLGGGGRDPAGPAPPDPEPEPLPVAASAPDAGPDAIDPAPETEGSASGETAPGETGSADEPDAGRAPSGGRRRRRAAPTGTGTVNVVVPDGWAIVYFRGRRLGQTPRRAELPAGRQTLELRFEGERPGRRVRVDVQPNETTPVVVRAH